MVNNMVKGELKLPTELIDHNLKVLLVMISISLKESG